MKRSTWIVGLVALLAGAATLIGVVRIERHNRAKRRVDAVLGVIEVQRYSDKDASDSRFPAEHHAMMKRLCNEMPLKPALDADDAALLCGIVSRGDAAYVGKDVQRGADGKVPEAIWVPLSIRGLEYITASRVISRALQLHTPMPPESRDSLVRLMLTMLDSPDARVRKDGAGLILESQLARDAAIRARLEALLKDEDASVRRFVALHLGHFDEMEPIRNRLREQQRN